MAYTTYGNYKIYYEVHGEGEPLVILNGIMMQTRSWHAFLSSFQQYRVILIDFLDQGLSDSAAGPYDHHVQVSIVDHVREVLSIDSFYLAGISYGAEVALQYALLHGKRVRKLAVFNCAAYTSPWLKDIGKAWQLAARTLDPDLFYHVTIPYIYSPGFYSDNHEWMASRKNLLKDVFTESFLGRMDRLIASSESYDIRERLKNFQVPTMIVGATEDYITPIDEARELHQSIPGSELSVLEDCGHASMYERAGMFASLIIGYLGDREEVSII